MLGSACVFSRAETMASNIEVRPATDSDIGAITEIYAQHVRYGTTTFEIDAPDAEEMRRRFLEVQHRGLPYLVADARGEVAGYAYVAPYRSRHAYRFTVENSVYVDSSRVGQRIGTQLIERLLPACHRAGVRQVIAIIGDSDNIASIRLHQKFEFRYVGVLTNVGFKFDKWIDTVLMQRSLE